jgi:Icc-related predicted phosphoesterase
MKEDTVTVNPLAEPQRIAFIGDLHMNDRWAVAAIEHAKAQGADVLVQVGDFGFTFEPGFVRAVTDALFRMDLPLLFIEGNHDWPGALRGPLNSNGLREIRQNLWHIPRGYRWQWGGLTFLGCGGAHSVDRQWRTEGMSWWPEEAITEADVDRCGTGRADVLICHDVPAGVPLPGVGRNSSWPAEEIAASDAQRALLREIALNTGPRLVVHGHHHRNYRAEVDYGYGRVFVQGLGMDGTGFDENLWIVDMDEVAKLAG